MLTPLKNLCCDNGIYLTLIDTLDCDRLSRKRNIHIDGWWMSRTLDQPSELANPSSNRITFPNYFISCTNPRSIAWIGMDLNDFPARSCCWSSTLFSQVAKLTLSEDMAE